MLKYISVPIASSIDVFVVIACTFVLLDSYKFTSLVQIKYAQDLKVSASKSNILARIKIDAKSEEKKSSSNQFFKIFFQCR